MNKYLLTSLPKGNGEFASDKAYVIWAESLDDIETYLFDNRDVLLLLLGITTMQGKKSMNTIIDDDTTSHPCINYMKSLGLFLNNYDKDKSIIDNLSLPTNIETICLICSDECKGHDNDPNGYEMRLRKLEDANAELVREMVMIKSKLENLDENVEYKIDNNYKFTKEDIAKCMEMLKTRKSVIYISSLHTLHIGYHEINMNALLHVLQTYGFRFVTDGRGAGTQYGPSYSYCDDHMKICLVYSRQDQNSPFYTPQAKPI